MYGLRITHFMLENPVTSKLSCFVNWNHMLCASQSSLPGKRWQKSRCWTEKMGLRVGDALDVMCSVINGHVLKD